MRTRVAFAALALAVGLAGCKDAKKELQLQIGSLKASQDSIVQIADSAKTELAAIDLALQSTEAKLMGVKLLGEGRGTIRERIDSINAEIDRQEAEFRKQARRITVLRGDLEARNQRITALQQRVDSLIAANQQLTAENAALKDSLEQVRAENAALKQKVADLTAELQQRDRDLAAKVAEVNTAYIIVGNESDLRAKGIIDKQGKTLFFGGRTAVAKGASAKYWSRVDISTDTEFNLPVAPDKVKIISSHPDGTYEVVAGASGATVRVTNADEFWRTTKLLVIALNDWTPPDNSNPFAGALSRP